MITYIIGNLFESPARVLVNTVNTVGVMGKGIAKDFKLIYPEMFKLYQEFCENGQLAIGKIWLYKTSQKWVLNFPTKTTWRKRSKIEHIESGLQAFVRGYAQRGITSIAFPQLGCGNGELDWENQVRPLMEKYLGELPIDVFIYLYKSDPFVPEHRDIKSVAQWLRAETKSLGFVEVWRDLQNLIGDGIHVKTHTNQRSFYVECFSDIEESGICFQANNKKQVAMQEELCEFWDLIRKYGFGLSNIMPAGLESISDELVYLFLKLDYCHPIKASTDYQNLDSDQSIGLQWLPNTEIELFKPLPFELQIVS
ncbi:MAG: O-acetyl-ADP-ribose deacetylase (regulator of RNase III) [Candidatus Latescibacterota bacterium]|jgi:O-acetyl-ADP-ribose deacetylase (regulator of RNase III)